ncbi:MAG: ABC transporter permease [Firmicutes bacterium]|jgi:ABC-2 type transport system permease protein|nr:ABC transporter permease [Bacillota bacterium]
MRSCTAFKNILIKDIKTYYIKPPNISWGIIFPIAWTAMFFVKSQTPIDIRAILPGVMSMSILFGTTSMLAVTITFERRHRSFERLLVAPIELSSLMLAKTLGAILFGIANASVPVIFASFLISLSDINWVLAFISVVLMATTSAFLGLFIAVAVSEVFEAQTFSNFFRFPMIFLCGLFIPVSDLPRIIRPLSYIIPLTYGADLLKLSINNDGHIFPILSLVILVTFGVVLFSLSLKNVKRKWIY